MQNNETYDILQVIGQGSGGTVYKAYHKRLGKEVVIKQIKSAAKQSLESRTEVDLLKGLRHMYIPQVYDFIEEGNETYTVMDYIDGYDIEKIVSSGRKLRYKEVLKFAIQLCEAVEYLHTRKKPIIHSDIKPQNVMVNKSGDICLIDFNVSIMFDGNNAQALGGTPGYAPPEQFGIPLASIPSIPEDAGASALPIGQGKMYVNEQSDIYSIGATIYYMLTGVRPSVSYHVKPLYEMGVRVSNGLAHIVSKAMELNPAKRYKSVSQMLTALRNVNKLDKRYIGLKVQREIFTVAAVVLMFVSVTINRAGKEKLAEEHEEKYTGYITEITALVDAGSREEAEELILKAITMEPTRLTPYYEQLRIYHNEKDFDSCLSYSQQILTPEILNDEYNSDSTKANVYEIAGNAAFEQGSYTEALGFYEKALFYNPEITDCYRDITISYARTGDIEKAQKQLEKAENAGVASDQLELMRGEISYMMGDFDAAYDYFRNTANITEDDYTLFRSILVCDNMMLESDDSFAASKMVTFILEQEDRVSSEYAGIVQEILANEYVRYSEQTGNPEYYYKAVSCYDKLDRNNQLSPQLQRNCFNILYSKLSEYERCLTLLDKMYAADPTDYWVSMNYAYTLISIENAKTDIGARDYYAAYEHFLEADELYTQYSGNTGANDVNMDNLRNAVNDLIRHGWIAA